MSHAETLREYLAKNGPSTIGDIQRDLGWTITQASQRAVSMMRTGHVVVEGKRGSYKYAWTGKPGRRVGIDMEKRRARHNNAEKRRRAERKQVKQVTEKQIQAAKTAPHRKPTPHKEAPKALRQVIAISARTKVVIPDPSPTMPAETVEEFLARGGQVQKLQPHERSKHELRYHYA